MDMELIRYVIQNKENRKFLDRLELEVDEIKDAMFFDDLDGVIDAHKEIDVSYIYDIAKIRVRYDFQI